jgi:hypothetical protein
MAIKELIWVTLTVNILLASGLQSGATPLAFLINPLKNALGTLKWVYNPNAMLINANNDKTAVNKGKSATGRITRCTGM